MDRRGVRPAHAERQARTKMCDDREHCTRSATNRCDARCVDCCSREVKRVTLVIRTQNVDKKYAAFLTSPLLHCKILSPECFL